MPEYQFLELTKKEDIIEHEKITYDAFINRAEPGWIYENYKRINESRLQSPFPYNDQVVIGIKKNGKLKLSLAINRNINNKMQLEKKGFTRDKIDKNSKYAEALSFASNGERMDMEDLAQFKNISNFINDTYKKYGIEKIYSSVLPRLKKFYSFIGFNAIHEIETKYGKLSLLEYIVK